MMKRNLLLASVAAFAMTAPAWAADEPQTVPDATATDGSIVAADAAADRKAPTRRHYRGVDLHPYIEVDQSVFAPLKSGQGRAYASTGVSAGVMGRIDTPRLQVGADAVVRHNFSWGKGHGDTDVLDGVIRGSYAVVPQRVFLDFGEAGTYTRVGIPATATSTKTTAWNRNFSAFVGPSVRDRIGSLDVGAAYRFGYTNSRSGGLSVLQANQLGTDFHSTSHVASAFVGQAPGATLPFGWRASAAFEQENGNQLQSRYTEKVARLDAQMPVGGGLSLVGGVGYEKIRQSQAQPQLDVNGAAVVDSNGHLVADATKPRVLSYDQSGFIWDTGVLYEPSSRMHLEARVGHRYGAMSYTGSIGYQARRDLVLGAQVYDGIGTAGRQQTGTLAALPTAFSAMRDPFTGTLGGCVFGAPGSASAGGCLNDAVGTYALGVYRNRGIRGALAYNTQGWMLGLGAGYSRRTLHLPGGTAFAALDGTNDNYTYVNALIGRHIDPRQQIAINLTAGWFDPGQNGVPSSETLSATAAYSYLVTHHLSATAGLGIYSTRIDGLPEALTGSGTLGARYTF